MRWIKKGVCLAVILYLYWRYPAEMEEIETEERRAFDEEMEP